MIRYWLNILVTSITLSPGLTDAETESSDSVQTLINQLGSETFSKRTQAERQLLDLGLDSFRAVSHGIYSEDPEIRSRSWRILELLEKSTLSQHGEQIRLNPWIAPRELTPGWDQYFSSVGDSEPARSLYVQLLQNEPELMLSLNRPGWKRNFERRCSEMIAFSNRRFPSSYPTETTCALLFLACHPDNAPSGPSTALINTLLDDSDFRRAARSDHTGPVLKALIAQWILRSRGSTSAQSMDLAAKYELKEGLSAAREIIQQRNVNKHSATHLPEAIMFLARYGREDAISELVELLDDETTVMDSYRSLGNSSGRVEIQVRDIALACLLYITNQDPREYGFHHLRPKQDFLYISSSIHFGDNDERARSFKKWQRWSAAHLKEPLQNPTDPVEGTLL